MDRNWSGNQPSKFWKQVRLGSRENALTAGRRVYAGILGVADARQGCTRDDNHGQ